MRAFFLSLCVLLLTGTTKGDFNIIANKDADGVKLECRKGDKWRINGINVVGEFEKTLTLKYVDENTGKYECFSSESQSEENPDSTDIYYVRFRTCDTCMELDWSALVGIIVGNVVATVLIGIAVYSISTQSRVPSLPSNKASQESDRRNLIQDDVTYQQLTIGSRDAYDVLNTRRK